MTRRWRCGKVSPWLFRDRHRKIAYTHTHLEAANAKRSGYAAAMHFESTSSRCVPSAPLCVLEKVAARLDSAPSLDAPTLAAALSDSVCITDVERWLAYAADERCRTVVRRTDTYELVVIGWLPGQQSPPHDHGVSSCAFRVVAGTASERRFFKGKKPQDVEHSTGSIVVATADEVHVVGNSADASGPMVTLHVYSPPLCGVGLPVSGDGQT